MMDLVGAQPVVEDVAGSRFEMAFPGGLAFANFRRDGDRLIVTHTEVPPAFNGRGLGSLLALGIFENARATGRRIVPACSFVAAWARRHPEFADVLAR
jgi:predicted GNAT family acetyltransferase